MSHFSKIQTSIYDIKLLKKTLIDLGFKYDSSLTSIHDANGRLYKVDLVAKLYQKSENNLCIGFAWDGDKYSIITDLDFWFNDISFDLFVEKLNQSYSINVILDQTINDGFQKINQKNLNDGSIKLTVQRWI